MLITRISGVSEIFDSSIRCDAIESICDFMEIKPFNVTDRCCIEYLEKSIETYLLF